MIEKRKFNIAINGFGRIGRCFLRCLLEWQLQHHNSVLNGSQGQFSNGGVPFYHFLYRDELFSTTFAQIQDQIFRQLSRAVDNSSSLLINVVAINSPNLDVASAAHLLQYDSTHGIFPYHVVANQTDHSIYVHSGVQGILGHISHHGLNDGANHAVGHAVDYAVKDSAQLVGEPGPVNINTAAAFKVSSSAKNEAPQQYAKILITSESDVSRLHWRELDIDLVVDCSGKLKDKNSLIHHIEAGASKVLVASPVQDDDFTLIFGVNESLLADEARVISLGSCTTNCFVPILKALDSTFGVEEGCLTSIHAYTNDQNLLDSRHKDWRRARAAADSIIPSSTGLNETLRKILPHLSEKISGASVRVPINNVSMLDFVFRSSVSMNQDTINEAILSSAKEYPNIVALTDQPLVSIDFNHSSFSCIFDMTQVNVIGSDKTFGRICAWYDNEWGFSNRLVDACILLAMHKFKPDVAL